MYPYIPYAVGSTQYAGRLISEEELRTLHR
jgi:hypothetical protein